MKAELGQVQPVLSTERLVVRARELHASVVTQIAAVKRSLNDVETQSAELQALLSALLARTDGNVLRSSSSSSRPPAQTEITPLLSSTNE